MLALSNFLEERYPLDLIDDDATGVGYLLKTRIGDVESFVEAVRRVAAGGSALDPEVVQRMVGRRRRNNPIDGLTPRERDVLSLMAEGKSNHGIADALGITPAGVEKHVTGLFHKLGLVDEPFAHRRVMAVLTMLRASVTSEQPPKPSPAGASPDSAARRRSRRSGRARPLSAATRSCSPASPPSAPIRAPPRPSSGTSMTSSPPPLGRR